MADVVLAFDAALDRPVPTPEGGPPPVTEAVQRAVAEAFEGAVAAARSRKAAALVLCGRLLDPRRASPAQAAGLRRTIDALAAEGCRTVFVADDPAACRDLSQMLGEPRGLAFVTPQAALELDVHGLAVEIASALAVPPDHPDTTLAGSTAPLRRRIVVGCDRVGGQAPDSDAATGPTLSAFAAAASASSVWSHPGTLLVWGSRRPNHGVAGIHHLPPLQARSADEPHAGGCAVVTLLERSDADAPAAAERRGGWELMPTHRVAWRTLAVESAAGGDEELATQAWAALEKALPQSPATLELVRVAVECGTSVARRVRVGEISGETLARLRQLYDAKSYRVWCHEVVACPGESLAPLGHARSGSRPGTTTSFSSALADIVADIEQAPPTRMPHEAAREAGWLALELIEST